MKILAIGNSFSHDATTYLPMIARNAGKEITVVNLSIGGCPYERHWLNIEKDAADYEYQINGQGTERRVSIREVLDGEGPWDYVITQQGSRDSGWAESYEPFLSLMNDYLRRHAPAARHCIHQTWAYQQGSHHEQFLRYHRSEREMYDRVTACYRAAAQRHDLFYIPCGDVIQHLRSLPAFRVREGGQSLCRDTYHMHLIYGRYATALVWARALLGISAKADTFVPQPEGVTEAADPALLEIIRAAVDELVTPACP